MRSAIVAFAAAVLAGCSGGPYSQQEKEVKAEVARYFAELNAQEGVEEQAAKRTRTDIDVPATSLVVNRYDWDLAGSVYPDITCPSCSAKIGTRAAAGTELRCPSCNQPLTTDAKIQATAQPMFEIRSGTNLPIVVLVRYVRHSLAYDPNSAVMVSSKIEATNPIKPITDIDQRGHGAYYAGGFYRVTSSALCTRAFVYRGGELRDVDTESVRKMMKDPPENPSVSQMKLGRWGAVEQPLVPWLGRAPEKSAEKKTSD